MVYVDDFTMAGPEEALPEAWALLQENLQLQEPRVLTKFLGVSYDAGTGPMEGVLRTQSTDLMKSCVEQYLALPGASKTSLKRVPTPFCRTDFG